jgi:hypothetical protein
MVMVSDFNNDGVFRLILLYWIDTRCLLLDYLFNKNAHTKPFCKCWWRSENVSIRISQLFCTDGIIGTLDQSSYQRTSIRINLKTVFIKISHFGDHFTFAHLLAMVWRGKIYANNKGSHNLSNISYLWDLFWWLGKSIYLLKQILGPHVYKNQNKSQQKKKVCNAYLQNYLLKFKAKNGFRIWSIN